MNLWLCIASGSCKCSLTPVTQAYEALWSLTLVFSSSSLFWRGPPLLLWWTSSAPQFVSTSFSHQSSLSSSTSRKKNVSLSGHCVAPVDLCLGPLAATSLTGERVAGTEPSLSDRTGRGGHPSGQEQKRATQEGKTPHPVWHRPSLLPTGRAVEPPVKWPFGQSVLWMWQGGRQKRWRYSSQTASITICLPDTQHKEVNLSLPQSHQWILGKFYL